MTESRPPFPPFTLETAKQKVQAAENAWNTRDPERGQPGVQRRTAQWRNRDRHVVGRAQIVEFLTQKWRAPKLDYVLRKSLWGFRENRMRCASIRMPRPDGQWYRSYGNGWWGSRRKA